MTTTFRPLSFEADDWGYIREHIPGFLYVEDVRGIVAIRNGKIGGMIFFDNWTVTACNAHQIVTTPEILIEGFLEEAWGWVFSPTGGKRVVVLGIYSDEATSAMLTAKRVGFKEIYRVVDGCRLGVDRVVSEMRKDDCRYAG